MTSPVQYSEIVLREREIEKLCLEYIEQSRNEFGKLTLSKQIAGKKYIEHHGGGEGYIDSLLARHNRTKERSKPKLDILLEICARISRLKKS